LHPGATPAAAPDAALSRGRDAGGLAELLELQARERPGAIAALWPSGRTLRRRTFAELSARVLALARGLERAGLAPGERALVFLRPGPRFVEACWALFRLGAVPVLIDPAMGRAGLLDCVRASRARALLGIPRAHLARLIAPGAFEGVSVAVCDEVPWPGALRFEALAAARGATPRAAAPALGDATAAVLYTSGSTGPSKGVEASAANLAASAAALAELFRLRPGQCDAACFPLFALFDAALGIASFFPRVDPLHPAGCDPELVFGDLEASAAGFAFASPAVWKRVVPWMRAHGRRFTQLATAVSAGAPVPAQLALELRGLLAPGGEVHTPYGATEALPIACLAGAELAGAIAERTAAGEGTCVGRAVPETEVELVSVDDQPRARFTAEDALPRGAIGEIAVAGAQVTRRYFADAAATAAAKMRDGNGRLWHRMGDLGRFDADGRLWFLGRKSERIETAAGLVVPVPAENVFAGHPRVERCALVPVGERPRQEAVLVVEASTGLPGGRAAANLARELLELGRGVGACAGVERVLFHPRLPVDARHNAKIRRGELARWATARLGR
jgi:acyl-CoA synthetase (AMP-forming)/AMP-acid ligase II